MSCGRVVRVGGGAAVVGPSGRRENIRAERRENSDYFNSDERKGTVSHVSMRRRTVGAAGDSI